MIFKRFDLDKEKDVYFNAYLHENSKELKPGVKRPAVVICPGGGYTFTSDREADPIAFSFLAKGFHVFVLRYHVGLDAKMPLPLRDLAATFSIMIKNSEEWYLEEGQIFVAGFSAGAHLAASLGVFWDNKDLVGEYSELGAKLKPAGLILGYPVIDLFSSSTRLDIGIQGYPDYETIEFGGWYPGTDPEKLFIRENNKTLINFQESMNPYILGGDHTTEEAEFYSLQNQVTKNTPPAFIWHGRQDGLIFSRNSLKFATALDENNISYELHVFATGDHGLGLANELTANNPWEIVPECEPWFELCVTWINDRVKELSGEKK